MKPSKKQRLPQPSKKAPAGPKLDLFSLDLPVPEPVFLAGLFLLALALKFVCLWQYSPWPDFANPVGDSENYLIQARAILAHGRLFGDTIPFQTPLYPIFLASLLAVSRQSLFFVRLVQIVMGAGNCLLVYFLARKIIPQGRLLAAVAGCLTAFYGLFTFFDVDILGISPAIFSLNLSLLLAVKARESRKLRWALGAGIFLGLAILERANLLLFLPFAGWYLASGFSFRFSQLREWSWKPSAGFLAAVFLMILPVTVNNYLVSRDFVLISSNAGVNLFLGNNPEADGTFRMPRGIGLTNYGMAETMVNVAEQDAGKKLKPSQVSRYWSRRATRFMLENPVAVADLYWRKLKILLSQWEYPNHLSFDFMKVDVMPFLNVLFLGFGWIAPWAFVGIWAGFRRGWNDPSKLMLAFLAAYAFAVLIFFITDRYRLPLVPLLIILAVSGLAACIQWLLQRQGRELAWAALILLLGLWVVYLPIPQRLAWSHTRTTLADRYADRADTNPVTAGEDYRQAILQYKQAIEVSPQYATPYKRLAKVYETIGYFSGSIRLMEAMGTFSDADHALAEKIIPEVRQLMAESGGDKVTEDQIPKTPFQVALLDEQKGETGRAEEAYLRIFQRDPYHFPACLHLGKIYLQRGESLKAIELLEKGIRYNALVPELLEPLAEAYYQSGNMQAFRKIKAEIERNK